jgi:Ca2+-binding RTX toxin-like protein
LKGVAAGVNTLIGGAGSDVITGGSGIDKITGADKADTIDAGAGDDLLYYLAATDLFTSTASVDSIVGGSGNDVITIGDGANTAFTIASTDLWTRISAVETIKTVASSGMVSVTLPLSAQTAGINRVDLSLATKTTTNVIDVSAFTTTATTLIGPNATGNADITGGGAADNITAGAAGGTIIGGGAADSITGAAGVDIIKWAATTPALLATETGSTAGVAVTFAEGTVGDKVATWVSGTDKLYFSQTLTNPAGTDSDILKVISKTGGTIANSDRFVHISDTASSDNVNTTAGAVTILNALTTSAVTIGASTIVAMDNDTNTYLWLVKQVSTADTIAAQDITLIGMVTGITTVTNGDFVSFA